LVFRNNNGLNYLSSYLLKGAFYVKGTVVPRSVEVEEVRIGWKRLAYFE
jgi:hypothetical protein